MLGSKLAVNGVEIPGATIVGMYWGLGKAPLSEVEFAVPLERGQSIRATFKLPCRISEITSINVVAVTTDGKQVPKETPNED